MLTLRAHLLGRGLDPDEYQVTLDEEEYIATFYLFNLSGQITGYQRYNPRSTDKKCNDPIAGRYYTYTPRGVDAIFGLETDNGRGPLFAVEGVFKQAAIHLAGFNAISVLTSNPKRHKPLLGIIAETRPVISIGDGDKAGGLLVNCVGRGACSLIDLDEMKHTDVIALCESLVNSY